MKKQLDLEEIKTRKQTERVAERLEGTLSSDEEPVWTEDFAASGNGVPPKSTVDDDS